MNHEALVTAGVAVGTSAVKTAVLRSTGGGAPGVEILALRSDRIRRRDLRKVIDESFRAALAESGLTAEEMAYVASTGEGELVEFRSGHFYGMTTHARGATYLVPEASAVLDVGALHARAMRVDSRSKVLASRMTSQCASGSGQFLENVARYLGVALAGKAGSDVVGTGGLAGDVGRVEALREKIANEKLPMKIHTHEASIHAGALGAALWGAHRHRILSARRNQGGEDDG